MDMICDDDGPISHSRPVSFYVILSSLPGDKANYGLIVVHKGHPGKLRQPTHHHNGRMYKTVTIVIKRLQEEEVEL